jgi:hypothetical protein
MNKPKLEVGFITIPVAATDYNDEGLASEWLMFAKEILDQTAIKLFNTAQALGEKNGVEIVQMDKEKLVNVLRRSLDIKPAGDIVTLSITQEGNILYDEDVNRTIAEGRSFNN